MPESEPTSGAIERGPRIGVAQGARVLRPKVTLETPLAPEEIQKFQGIMGAAAPSPPPPPPRQKPLALVADDSPQLRQLCAMVLNGLGFDCLEVSDGAAALREAAKSPPDLLLLDLSMPLVDGYEVLRGIRSYLKQAQTIIMVITGAGKEEDEETALGLGADDYLVKPVKAARLAARVKAIGRRVNAAR